ncbi:MAG: hypothetical protein H8E87_03110 [FCB group bacterium]|nr:hypothetical protein [FCB group bacterium]
MDFDINNANIFDGGAYKLVMFMNQSGSGTDLNLISHKIYIESSGGDWKIIKEELYPSPQPLIPITEITN